MRVLKSERPAVSQCLGRVVLPLLTVTLASLLLHLLLQPAACAQEPKRSFFELVSSNGYTGVVVNLQDGQVHHFREHIYATEEPRWEDDGTELWIDVGGECNKPQAVASRDLLHDAYFGVAARSNSLWLNTVDVDMDASGYDAEAGREGDGGTGIIRMVQPLTGHAINLETETRVFAPWSFEGNAFVMLLTLTNPSDSGTGPFSVYGLVNTRLGFGRPGPRQETGAESETITTVASGLLEQGFAGLVYVVGFEDVERISHSPAAFYQAVADNLGDLPAPGESPYGPADDVAGALQWDRSDLAAGESVTIGMIVVHHPDPNATDLLDDINTWIDARTAAQILTSERAGWEVFQDRVEVPSGLTGDEVALLRHSAAILRMAQIREEGYFLRDDVLTDTQRYTGIDDAVSAVTAGGQYVEHRGTGAVLASLPPGEWAYAWVRDGAYAVVGLTDAGLYPEARDALTFYMDAYNNRYVDYGELTEVPLADYGVTLTRYHGFGVEESDTTCNGDFNFEWDGFGLFLWALRHYVEESSDATILDVYWDYVETRIADVIEGLIEEDGSGLVAADSSIWEVHWMGDQKHFGYTSITAARGLCDAAWLAEQTGDDTLAVRYDAAGRRLRRAIYQNLRNVDGAIAANTEELGAGTGYWDAAVIEAVGMGLFDPEGDTAQATISNLRSFLTVAYGPGLARNDDEFDSHSLSDYGGWYDSLEWIFLDYRMSIAARHAGETEYADTLQSWVRDQTLENFLLIAENYDKSNGEYRNNAPMIGFGAGSFITAMRQRQGEWAVDPACGVYFEDDTEYGLGTIGPGDDLMGDEAADVGTSDVEPPDAGDDDAIGVDSGVTGDTSDLPTDGGEASDTTGEDAPTTADSTSGGDTTTTSEDSGGQTTSGRTDTTQSTEPDDEPAGSEACGCAARRSTPPWGAVPVALLSLGVLVRRRRRPQDN